MTDPATLIPTQANSYDECVALLAKHHVTPTLSEGGGVPPTHHQIGIINAMVEFANTRINALASPPLGEQGARELIEQAVQASLDAGLAVNGEHGVAAARHAARFMYESLAASRLAGGDGVGTKAIDTALRPAHRRGTETLGLLGDAAAMREAAAKVAESFAALHADMVLDGLPEQARLREAMEGTATWLAAAIRALPAAEPAPVGDDLYPFDDGRPQPPGPSSGPRWLRLSDGRIFVSRAGRPTASCGKLEAGDLARVKIFDGRATLAPIQHPKENDGAD